jgi:hypothetical protein
MLLPLRGALVTGRRRAHGPEDYLSLKVGAENLNTSCLLPELPFGELIAGARH